MSVYVILALFGLVIAMVVLLVGAFYVSVTKYAKRLDPSEREHQIEARH